MSDGSNDGSIGALDLADPDTLARVHALQRAAYRVEADLIGHDGIPPLHETPEALRTCGETFLGAVVEGVLAGAVSYRVDGAVLDLHRVMVHPDFFRRGLARRLVGAAEAAAPGAARVVVSTGSLNVPAQRLYEGLGFREVGEREVAPGLRVTTFEKRRGANGA